MCCYEILEIIEQSRKSRKPHLSLACKGITELPSEISKLNHLESLDLRGNHLTALPEVIGCLANLTSLSLSHNRLKEVPGSIGQLKNLSFLSLNHNELKELPSSISKLSKLIELIVSFNYLSDLPRSIGKLSELTNFSLSSNNLTRLPESIGQLTKLTCLSLSCNQLVALPESIGKLTKLTSLSLSHNRLSSLPESIGELTNLIHLPLNHNHLETLPESIGKLGELVYLSLDRNRLVELPHSIGQLTNLTSLGLLSNQLTVLPESIGQLVNLEALLLNRTQWKRIPPEILAEGGLAVRDYFTQRWNEKTDHIYEAKLLIIGEGGAGKTTLTNKLIDPNYQLRLEGSTNPEETTEGIDVLRFHFPHLNRRSFRINIWDFGGQEIYHATHQFFITRRSLYILVADSRQNNTDFNYWLEAVELLSDASPIIIVKNEKQDRSCQVNERQLRGRFQNLKETLATNLLTNRGLVEIFRAMKRHIAQLPHIGHPLPSTWVRVRKSLEEDPRNYISQAEFLKLCDSQGFKNRKDKLQLSSYLHDLGVCLHFQDDPLLKHFIILKPEWATTAVYRVLDTPSVRQNLGCFTDKDLSKIWGNEQYADMRDELLQLMMRFKLCYEIPYRPQNYIAPQLLSPNQPNYYWNTSNNIILRYKYEFMPKGILSRFIVEMHRFIDKHKDTDTNLGKQLVWKDGVVLTYSDKYNPSSNNPNSKARAEVVEAYYCSELRIRISGKIKKPLLEIVRHEIEKIHTLYNKPEDPPENHRLKYQEFIPCNCSQCKGSQTPYSYPLQRLETRLKNNRLEIECDNSYEMVSVRSLIDDVLGPDSRVKPVVNQTEAFGNGSKPPMELDGRERRQFQKALLSAFPSKAKLEQMLSFELDWELDSIAEGQDQSDLIFNLIKYAKAQGKLSDLLSAAQNANASNSALNEFARYIDTRNE